MDNELCTRIEEMKVKLREFLDSTPIAFASTPAAFPASPGIYRIFDPVEPAHTIRAGRATTGHGLRQRLYVNHLMGNQPGNLRSQLVADGVCENIDAAKTYIRTKLVAQVLRVEDQRELVWLEHFMHAVLRPRYCD